jgi:hypothetical protein
MNLIIKYTFLIEFILFITTIFRVVYVILGEIVLVLFGYIGGVIMGYVILKLSILFIRIIFLYILKLL